MLVVASERAGLERIGSGDFDPRSDVIVERDQPGVRRLAGTGPAGTVAVTREQNSEVSLRADLQREAIVVLGDAIADGWTVSVDGRPRPAVRVDDVMRGVIVPAGRHAITWRYRVPGLRLGLLLSVVTIVAVLLVGGLGTRVRRRITSLRTGRAAAADTGP